MYYLFTYCFVYSSDISGTTSGGQLVGLPYKSLTWMVSLEDNCFFVSQSISKLVFELKIHFWGSPEKKTNKKTKNRMH